MKRRLLLSLLILSAFMQVSTAQFTRGNLVVLQVGTGAATLTNASTAFFIKEYTTSGTSVISTVTIPTTGANSRMTQSGTATSEGMMTRSPDGTLLVFGGYDTTTGTGSINGTAPATYNRSIGTVNGAGTFSRVAKINNALGSGIRGATGDGAGNYWASGNGNGIIYVASGGTAGTIVSATVTNNRNVAIYNGQLYSSTGSGTTGVYQVGTGTPTTTGQTSTQLFGTSTSPYSFAFNAQGTVCYVGDDVAGIRKYTYSGSSWTQAYVLNTTKVTSLTVDFSTSIPVVYATAAAAATANTIIKVNDSGLATTLATVVATAPTNTVFRGVAFAPSGVLNLTTFSGVGALAGTFGAGGTPGSFSVNGTNLNNNATVTVTAPTNFEVSTSSGSGYGSSVSLTASGTSLSATTVYIRTTASAPAGAVGGQVTVASTGATGNSLRVDGTVAGAATLTISGQSGLTTLASVQNSAGTPGSYVLNGSNLTGNVTVTAPTNFEVATTSGGSYSSSLTLTPSGGTITNQNVFVRITNTAPIGSVSGTVTNAATGATTQNVSVSGTVAGPSLSISNQTGLTSLASTQGVAGIPGSYQISGTNLTSSATITAPTNFELSTTSNGTYTSSLTLTQSGGTLPGQPVTIYVRITATAPAGAVSGTITNTATNATTQNVSVSGTVTGPLLTPSVTTLSGFTATPTTTSAAQSFTLTGTNLAANTTVTISGRFEISLNDTTYTTGNLTIMPSSGSISQTIYARIPTGASLGAVLDTIRMTSGTASATVTLSGYVTQAFTAGNIAVSHVGDGSATLASTGNQVFIDEYTPAGTFVQTIPLPTVVSGSNKRLIQSGTATSEGALTRSADGQYLALAGYDATPPTANLSTSTGAAVNRTIGLIDYNATIDVTTTLSNYSSGNNPRGAFTTNGTNIWAVGGVGGVVYATKGATTGTVVSSTNTNIRTLNYAEYGKDTGQLFFSSGSGSLRIARVGVGTPTTGSNTAVALPGVSATLTPYQIFFADLNDAVAGADVMYAAIDSGGINKYSYNGTTWTLNGTMDNAIYRGLAGKADASGNIALYAIRGFGTTYADSGSLVSITDATGWNGTPSTSPTITVLVNKNIGSKMRFSGVALAPVNNSVTGNTKIWTGNGSARYGFAGNWTGFTAPTSTSDVVIGNNGINQPRLASDTQNAGSLTIGAGTTLSVLTNGVLNAYGTITNNGTFNTTNGEVGFKGSGAQTIPTITARNITFNGSSFSLSGSVTATNSLTFTSGIVDLGANNLTVAQGATLIGGSASSYARTNSSGKLKAYVSTTPVTFPVGVSAYNPATLTNDGAGATETGFSIRVLEIVLQDGTSGSATTKPVVNRTWLIDNDNTGAANASLTLQWNSGETMNGFSPAHVYIAHYNTTTNKWEPFVADTYTAPAATGSDPFTTTATGITSFSPFTVGGGGMAGPLPVRISTLSAFTDGTQNLLTWDSYEEEPGLRYQAEYSADGKTFSPISEITAAGYAQHYTVKHQPESKGAAYYRIVVLELNGNISYSNTAMVKTNGADAQTGSVYPNPAGDYLQLQIPGDLNADATLTVVDASGRVVISEPVKTQTAIVDLHRLPVGLYQLRVMNGGQVETYRVVKQQ